MIFDAKEIEIKEFEEVLEHKTEQNNQKDHCMNKLKDDLQNEKYVNEELEEELKINEIEIKNLQICVQNRDDIINQLNADIIERTNSKP